MSDTQQSAEFSKQASLLAERTMHAQAVGNTDEADRLLTEAQRLDPDAVAVVLNAHNAAVAPDARDIKTANKDAERVRRVGPNSDPAA